MHFFAPQVSALLLNDWTLTHRIMSELDEHELFWDEVLFGSEDDCSKGCAPPEFDLPPPPRPPWMGDLDNCQDNVETCDNTVVLDPQFEDTFHSVAVIVVCAIVLVIMLLGAAVIVFKRRKRPDCHSRFDTQPKQLEDDAKPAPAINRGTFNLESHFPNNQSLPNHYIPDCEKQKIRTMLRADPRLVQEQFRQRFNTARPSRNLMELSNQPDSQQGLNNYPHILIGGQPFYLIPSSPSPNEVVESSLEEDQPYHEIGSYSYAQCDIRGPPSSSGAPIYEEIDKYYLPSEHSDQCEVGSIPPTPLRISFRRPDSSHTNSSELSAECDSSSSGCIKPSPRIMVNPIDNRNRSPQSIYANRLATRTQPAAKNSIYYYSDTLRRGGAPRNASDDSSDSGISNRSGKQQEVNTKVVLEDAKLGSTLV